MEMTPAPRGASSMTSDIHAIGSLIPSNRTIRNLFDHWRTTQRSNYAMYNTPFHFGFRRVRRFILRLERSEQL